MDDFKWLSIAAAIIVFSCCAATVGEKWADAYAQTKKCICNNERILR